MFSYFGSKSKLVHLYPEPIHDLIVEPFAGSARYACRYFRKDVWINDLSPTIYGIWVWIKQASRNDIRSLPELKPGEFLDDYVYLSQPERDLLGFSVSMGVSSPNKKMTEWAYGSRRDGSKLSELRMRSTSEIVRLKHRLLESVGKINHWKITNLSYSEMDNAKATWFIDPPYQKQGLSYPFSDVDYAHLGDWSKLRLGQVIVCESNGADWLPFTRLTKGRIGSRQNIKSNYHEVVWTQGDNKGFFADESPSK